MAMGLFDPVFGRGEVAAGGEAWLRALLEVEAALARAVERAGLAPAGSGASVTEAAATGTFELTDLGTELTGNPVPGLVRALARQVPEAAREAVHRGATSQDVMDCAAMLLARRAFDVIGSDLAAAAAAAARLAGAHRATVMAGRTLLQQAVPVTFGLVAAGWLSGLDEARGGLAKVGESRLAVQFGGAAGTLAALGRDGPRVTSLLAAELGLAVPVLPWHTDRLRIIDVAAVLARVTAVLGKVARDVTLLAQSEVGEVRESDSGPAGPVRRGGSSAMPHKNNPVAAIAVLGCTRQVPALVATLISAAEAEHQRAAGAWHAEWEPWSALLRLTGSAACWGAELLGGLTVDVQRMAANLAASRGLPLAEQVTGLLATAVGPVQAHDLVAGASDRAVLEGRPLGEVLLSLPGLADRLAAAGISAGQVDQALQPAGYLGATDVYIDAALAAHGGLNG